MKKQLFDFVVFVKNDTQVRSSEEFKALDPVVIKKDSVWAVDEDKARERVLFELDEITRAKRPFDSLEVILRPFCG